MSQNIYDPSEVIGGAQARGRSPHNDDERQHQNTMRLDGKVAVITGGGTGIGAAAARSLAAAGARVAVTGRRPEPLQAVAQEIGGFAVAGDAAKADEVRNTLAAVREHFGGAPIDVVVANAGGHGLGSALDTDDAGWATSWDVNVTTAFLLAREALPDLIQTQGSIVVVSSLAGVMAGPDVLGYTTGKHALIGLTKSLARDYGKHGVRANAVCPGWVRTPMADEQMDELGALGAGTREEAYALATSEVPLRRAATAEDIANIVTFLASPLSAAMTGTTVMADCGAHVVDLPTLAFERLQQH